MGIYRVEEMDGLWLFGGEEDVEMKIRAFKRLVWWNSGD